MLSREASCCTAGGYTQWSLHWGNEAGVDKGPVQASLLIVIVEPVSSSALLHPWAFIVLNSSIYSVNWALLHLYWVVASAPEASNTNLKTKVFPRCSDWSWWLVTKPGTRWAPQCLQPQVCGIKGIAECSGLIPNYSVWNFVCMCACTQQLCLCFIEWFFVL